MVKKTQKTQEEHKALEGNTNQSRARRWCLTLNNYTDDEYKHINTVMEERNYLYIIGKEVGSQGTPHLQIYIEATNAITFQTIKNICNRFHIEKAKGKREDNLTYCSKDGNYISNFPEHNKEKSIEELLLDIEYKDVVWRDWQTQIINILEQPIDKRKIHWVVDDIGNKGKSFLCKYIALKYNAIICSGKTGDIFNQVLGWREMNENVLQIPPCLVDVPRSEFSHINYAAIEQLKNGFLYSGKYEGGKVFGLSPHVFVFANSEPRYSQMSEDRWNVINLNVPQGDPFI